MWKEPNLTCKKSWETLKHLKLVWCGYSLLSLTQLKTKAIHSDWIWIHSNEVAESKAYYTEWSKSEREI